MDKNRYSSNAQLLYSNYYKGEKTNFPLVSIIIPIFNIEDYLEDCINSVIYQKYQNIEIILVDDGSTDRSGRICDDFVEKDKRIKVIHKSNGGLSDARNVGIQNADGIYLFFLDGDDLLMNNAIEILVYLSESNNCDISVTGRINIYNTPPKTTIGIKGDYIVMTGESAIKEMCKFEKILYSACGKLYKAKLWEDIKFPIGLIYEDLATIYYIFELAEKVCYFSVPLYCYRQRPSSITRSKNNKFKYDPILIEIVDKVTNDLRTNHPRIKEYILFLKIFTYLMAYRGFLYSKSKITFKNKEIITNLIRSNLWEIICLKDIRKYHKLLVLSFCISDYLFYGICNLVDFGHIIFGL